MTAPTIESLVTDLKPVTPLKPGSVAFWLGAATIAATLLVLGLLGPRPGLEAVALHPVFLLRAGILLFLGVAASAAVIRMARPSVGRSEGGWRWALAAAAAVALISLLHALRQDQPFLEGLAAERWINCMVTIMILALAIGSLLVGWLRKGAPTALAKAGWLTGLAAGSFAALAYTIHCPHNALAYIGVWYSIAVALTAIAGRLIVPPIIRW